MSRAVDIRTAMASHDPALRTDSAYLLELFNASWDLAQTMRAHLDRMRLGPDRLEYAVAATRLWEGVRWLECVLDCRPDLERIP